ncbi:MAG: RNA 2',3'-cyclic phosphodiesterase [Desulfobulbaceae bacterium]|nr:RNA 2',3'-cyclic phosphodiesterase [Desulfobulbaceae bacterium]HIJ79446.1 RNA 2',3'-cyclic phosphodiesterase [Deltaproteobacteria bacterium]
MYRLFIAIDLPEQVAQDLGRLCCGLPGARWVAPEQMHLTLRFVGEVDGALFREIKEGLAEIESPPFNLRLSGLGFFPPRKQPRVLWAGVEPQAPVIALRNKVERAVVSLGLEPEGRKFSPHLTMARLRETPLARLTRYLAGNAMYASPEFTVNEFHLYSSVLTAKGAMHRQEASYPLATGG